MVVMSCLYIASFKVAAVRAARPLRALRPLRLINKTPGLRKTISAVIKAMPDVASMVIVYLLLQLVFAVVLVTFFRGQYRSCQGDIFNDVISQDRAMMTTLQYPRPWLELTDFDKALFGPSSPAFQNCSVGCSIGSTSWPDVPCSPYEHKAITYMNAVEPTSRMVCELWGGSWEIYHNRVWDNVPQAIINLFQLSTLEGWTDNMWTCVDQRGIDMQPIHDYNVGWVYFWILAIAMGAFLGINLFVGAITKSFCRNYAEDGNMLMTDEQREWVTSTQLVLRVQLLPQMIRPAGLVSGLLFDFCQNVWFERVTIFILFGQCILLASESFGQSEAVTRSFRTANLIIAILFVVEAILKIMGYGPRQYFAYDRNKYDFVVVLLSIAGSVYSTLMNNALGGVLGNIVRIMRVFRLVRVLSVTMRELLATVVVALPAVFNVITLFILGKKH